MEESADYIWFTKDILGRGASGTVYRGIEKTRGEPVAVKSFGRFQLHESELREFELLERIKHENIVKMLKVEQNLHKREIVLVMELCNGGSLAEILLDPKNSFGLPEEEFFLFLGHLTAGMEYLRSQEIVHRDLKPENIMKFIRDDGTSVYKLIDFGAARQLSEDEEFTSLYGTEEYLHPDVYERAFPNYCQNRNYIKKFGISVDLWSIGVTIYRAAAGRLPFVPHGGRNNKPVMHQITSNIGSGIISGIQKNPGGAIEWSKTLPKDCRLSAGLKRAITPILAGVLETNKQKMWNFEQFFSEVQKILTAIKIDIFHVNQTTSLKIYLNEKSIEKLQEQIAYQTRIHPHEQIILFKDRIVDSALIFDNFTSISVNNPLLLFCRMDESTEGRSIYNVYSGPEIQPFPNFSKSTDHRNYIADAKAAKRICSIAYVMQHQIENLSNNCNLITKFVTSLDEALIKSYDKQITTYSTINRIFNNLINVAIVVDGLAKATDKSKLSTNKETFTEKLNNLQRSLSPLAQTIIALEKYYLSNDHLIAKWKNLSVDIKAPDMNRSKERAQTFVQELPGILDNFFVRARISPRNIDIHLHALDKTRLNYITNSINELFDECTLNANRMCEVLDVWYNDADRIYNKIEMLTKEIKAVDERLSALHDEMGRFIHERKNSFKQIIGSLNEESAMKSTSRDGVKEMQKAVSEIKSVKEEFEHMKILQENFLSMIIDVNSCLETMK